MIKIKQEAEKKASDLAALEPKLLCEYLPIGDLISLAQSNQYFAINIPISYIQSVLANIEIFNDLLKDFSHPLKETFRELALRGEKIDDNKIEIFKFNIDKWKKIFGDLIFAKKKIKTILNPKELLSECHLDLIEALAEYNITERCYIKKQSESLLQNFSQWIDTNPAYTIPLQLRSAIGEANHTYKSLLKINTFTVDTPNQFTLFSDSTRKTRELICRCQVWRYGNLLKRTEDFPIHSLSNIQELTIAYNHLVGTRHGDRIIVQTKDAQHIFRIDSGNSLHEEELLKRSVNLRTMGLTLEDRVKTFEAYKDLLMGN